MRVKLSETVLDRELNMDENPPDAPAARRIKDMALLKAGFEPKRIPRRIGKRAATLLAAALALTLAFAAALAATDLGVMIADMFRDYGGPRIALDALGLYGSAVGSEDSANGVTVRVEAAYASAAETMLALSFRDEQGRLGEDMSFSPTLSARNVEVSGSSYFTPKMTADGEMSALVSFSTNRSLAGKNARLTIDDIVPSVSSYHEQATSLTLEEAINAPLPLAIPGVPEARLVHVGMEEGGLVIAVEYPSDGALLFDGVSLKRKDGTILECDQNQTFCYLGDDAQTDKSESGFSNADPDALKDAELLLSYRRKAQALPGTWTLAFKMPRGASEYTEVPIGERVNLDGQMFLIESASLHPACVIVRYSLLDEAQPEEPATTGSVFREGPRSPEFHLLDGAGNVTAESGSTWYIGESDGQTHYQAVIHCLTEKQDSIALNVTDGRSTGAVLFSKKLI